MTETKKEVKIKDNKIYCYRCNRWFFSTKFLKTGKLPQQCNLCKRLDYNVKDLKRNKR